MKVSLLILTILTCMTLLISVLMRQHRNVIYSNEKYLPTKELYTIRSARKWQCNHRHNKFVETKNKFRSSIRVDDQIATDLSSLLSEHTQRFIYFQNSI